MSDEHITRKKIKIKADIQYSLYENQREPYVIVLDPKKRTESDDMEYDLEITVNSHRTWDVQLLEIRPVVAGGGQVLSQNPTDNGKKIVAHIRAAGSSFPYDLLYMIDLWGPCEAYTIPVPPGERRMCNDVTIAPHPPPEVLIP